MEFSFKYIIITWWNSCNFQSANSYIMLEFIHFHDSLNLLLTFILLVVAYFIVSITFNKVYYLYLKDNHILERIWIFTPSLLLIKIAVPSLAILYLIDDLVDSSLRLKVNAHQWFWRYEYTDFYPRGVDSSLEFDRYIIPEKSLELNEFRLLETENRPVLPYSTETQILITRIDVLHSWTVPSLGVKADANPGRINHVKIKPYNPGVFYGQCSEICGANHRFMPISLEFISAEYFLDWIIRNRNE